MDNYTEYKELERTYNDIHGQITIYRATLATDTNAREKGKASPVTAAQVAEAKAGIMELEAELMKVKTGMERAYFGMTDRDKKATRKRPTGATL